MSASPQPPVYWEDLKTQFLPTESFGSHSPFRHRVTERRPRSNRSSRFRLEEDTPGRRPCRRAIYRFPA